MAGTLKMGGATRANTTTVLTFLRPAGRIVKLNTAKDTETSAEVATSEMHGDGSVAPYAIAYGEGKASYKTSIAQHEWREIVAIAKAANIPLLGDGGLRFDITQTTKIDGVPKMTVQVKSAGLGKTAGKISADGNMVDIEGPCLNIIEDGVKKFREVA